MRRSTIINYCTGCGACVSGNKADLIINKDGFPVAEPKADTFVPFCEDVCFACGKQQYKNKTVNSVWGEVISSKYAWSSDEKIRFKASSGGTLTALCLFLLETGKVDGIVHTAENPSNPIDTITTLSTCSEEIVTHSGSRYSPSAPLKSIHDYISDGKKYCFVGKPCDVASLRNLMESDDRFKKTFVILLSFFCAGAPSITANETLLMKMGTNLKNCSSLRYRGDGWPGYATAIDNRGHKFSLDYRSAWRDTLGRAIRPVCRFCIDGIGEMADIVCYDAWYMDKDKKPIFDEAQGRNGVFCRTIRGESIFNEAVEKGYVVASNYLDYNDELPHFQRYQYTRRVTLLSTFLAMKLMFRPVPNYPLFYVFKLARLGSFIKSYSRFIGTIKRILKGKI